MEERKDTISRHAAIDALDKRFDDVPMELTTEILQLRRDLRERIPSAQPATSCSEIPNSSDTISRQAAVEALEAKKDKSAKGDMGCFYNTIIQNDIDALKGLPSAQPEPSQVARDIATIIENEQDMRVIARSIQPEPLTDKEQRIFLTAMAREEKVCRQVDDECRDRTPYEVSLVHVCREIRRKVKGALWA